MRKLLLLLFLFMTFSAACSAAVLNCDGSVVDCQNKVNSAVDGDTVQLPAGTFTWNATDCVSGRCIGFANKNITIQGTGIGSTIINGPTNGAKFFYYQLTNTAKSNGRISGMTLQGGTGIGIAIYLDATALSVSSYGFRIDHIFMNYLNATATPSNGIQINGIWWGVVDHCTFNGNMNGVVVYSFAASDTTGPGTGGNGAKSHSLPLNLGTKEAVYVEDCTYVGNTSGQTLGVDDMEYGARLVFRHNSVTGEYIQSHSARGVNRGGSLKIEAYNNTFTGTANSIPRFSLILAGTGVIFNNTITGYSSNNNVWFGDQRAAGQFIAEQFWGCIGSGTQAAAPNPPFTGTSPPAPYAWNGNVESTGWPCLDQIGRGVNTTLATGSNWPLPQPTVPYLMWNNGTTSTCSTGGACDNAMGVSLNGSPLSLAPYIQATSHSNGDVDYCLTTTEPATCGNYTNNYTPFVYPHPLVGASAATPIFSPGAGTYSTAQTVTISTTTPSAILCWNTTGSPATNGFGTACSNGTLINASSGNITVSVTETVYAVAGTFSLSDSSIGSAGYTISTVSPTAPCPTCFVLNWSGGTIRCEIYSY